VTGRNQDGRIPWRDIEDYADRIGLDPEIPFKEIIRALEREFGSWQEEERVRKARQQELSRSGPGGKQRTPK